MTLKFLADLINKITGIFLQKCFSRLRLFDWTIFAVFLGFCEGDDVEGGDVVLHLSREIRPKRIDQVRIVDGEEQFRENLKFIFLFSLTVNYEKVPIIIFLLQGLKKP
jgi:hypothetical protein